MWHRAVVERLRQSDVCAEVGLIGAKVRASVSDTLFLDIHYDPTTGSYSYALIDLTLPYPGDKRVFGWDDYPHESVPAIRQLRSHPHHFQRRSVTGEWLFEESNMRGDVEREINVVAGTVQRYLTRVKA